MLLNIKSREARKRLENPGPLLFILERHVSRKWNHVGLVVKPSPQGPGVDTFLNQHPGLYSRNLLKSLVELMAHQQLC